MVFGRHAGFTLIEAVIGIAIASGIAVAAATAVSNAVRAKNSVILTSDRILIKKALMTGVDCTLTLAAYNPPSSCSGSVALLDGSGNPLVTAGSNGTKIGTRWQVRATCSSSGIDVRVAAFQQNSTRFLADPLTGVVLNWNSPMSSLFPPGFGPCQSAFATSKPVGLLFGGTISRCPFDYDPVNGYKRMPIPYSRIAGARNPYTGTYNCPPGFVPRLSSKFENLNCADQGSYCGCGWSKSNPSYPACGGSHGSASDEIGCGNLEFMCVKSIDGSPIPPDGSGYD